jgi:integrase
VTPHTLRHTYISILLLVTDNVPYVMEQVGHDDEATTDADLPPSHPPAPGARDGVRQGRRAGARGVRRAADRRLIVG